MKEFVFKYAGETFNKRSEGMGREIRMVPPNWRHPKKQNTEVYQPMFGESYAQECRNWKDEFLLWEKGERGDHWVKGEDPDEYWDWNGAPPDQKYYSDFEGADCTWYQLYETVSEGTPITPPFPCKDDLINYLVDKGDFWYQEDQLNPSSFGMRRTKPTRKQAESLVNSGFAVSGILTTDGKLLDAYQQQDLKTNDKTNF